MVMNLTPGYYDVFYDGAIQSQISEKFVCPLASQNTISYISGEDIYQLLNSISVRSGPRFSSRMAHNEVP